MNYELAKQLKEAGFRWMEGDSQYEYRPCLSELIEACGDKLECVVQINSKKWQCNGFTINKDTMFPCTFGSTPEEAVANLWLGLNKPHA